MTLAPRSMDVVVIPDVDDLKPGVPGQTAAGTGALFESIVINANDVVLVTEAEPVDLASGGPRVLYVNPAFTRMTGYTPAEIVGLTPRILQSPKTDRRELDRLRAALSRWKPVEVELLNVRKDGTEFWVQINITPVCDASGWWTHWVAVQRDITARKSREAAVTAMLENTSDVMLVVDAAGMLTDASPSCLRLLQLSSAVLVGLPVSRLVHPDDLDQLRSVLASVNGLRHGPRAATELRLRQQDGGWLWVAVDGSDLDPESGGRVLLSCPDISARKQAEAELQAMHGRFRGAFDDAPIGMALSLPSGQLVQVNAALCELLGYDAATLNTKTVQDITHPDDIEPGRRQRQALLDGTSRRHRHETRFVNAQGIVVGVLHSCSVVPSTDGTTPHLVDHIEDITERKLFETHLRHEALHDTLTGLPNRALLMDRLEQALATSGRTHAPIAVLFLDVDRFKAVNDTYGHHVGDEVLIAVADRLRAALRPGDTACRLAGDEFVVLCENCTPDQAVTTAARLVNVLSRPLAAADTTLVVSASIGIAVSRPGDNTPESLLHDADAAMYIAKGNGRGLVEVFDELLGEQVVLRVRREAALAHAIPNGQLRLHFQPEINLSDGTTVGVEALVRWQHPEEGLLPPAAFIALAEDTGLITDLGNWVLDAALAEAARLRDLGCGEPVMWVNLSAHQIQHPGLADTVAESLNRHGLPGAALGLEITESVLMRDFEASRATLLQLKQMGVSLAIDDFGTGYSSLSYLARFPVDTVKIDRYFTSGLDDVSRRRESFAIISAVIGLAHALDLRVVAEGIETESQSHILHGLGCDHGQGYLLGRPLPRNPA